MFDTVWQDVRDAGRALRAQRMVAPVAGATLALGISGNTSIFAIAKAVLDPELPYSDADRILVAYSRNPAAGVRRGGITPIEVAAWNAPPAFAALGAYELTDFNFAASGVAGAEAEHIAGARASSGVFDALRIVPSPGRLFTAAQDRPGAEPVALITHALWVRRFASLPSAVGSTIVVHGRPHTVTGVLPERFVLGGAEVWIPLAMDAARATSSRRSMTVVGRLAPGASPELARSQLVRMSEQVAGRQPDIFRGWTVDVMPLHDWVVGQRRQVLHVLQVAVLVVLLIACSNIANVQLARAATRRREFALRSALGASRGRLVRYLLTEGLVLSVIGAAAALLVSAGELRAARAALPADVPSWVTFRIDAATLAFTLALATGTALLFGLAAALHGSRADAGQILREDARTLSGSRRLGRIRSTLLAGQLALAMALFVIAAALVQFSRSLRDADPGFDPAGVVSARLTLPEDTYPTDDALRSFHQALLGRVRAIPRVRAVTVTSALPGVDGGRLTSVRAEGGTGPGRDSAAVAESRSVSPGYFDALSVRRITGMPFTAVDIARGNVVAINEPMARALFPGGDAMGHLIIVGAGDSSAKRARIVGVVRDTSGVSEGPTGWGIYRPLEQAPARSVVVAVRASGDFGPVVRELRRVVRGLDPLLPLYDVQAVADMVRRRVWAPRAFGFVLGVLAALALTLAMLGVYGVAAYSTILQRREIGIRLALGARSGAVVMLFVRRSLRLAGIGMGIGAIGALAGSRILSARLGVPSSGVTLLLGSGLVLALATMAATYLPSRHAARLDPLATLRAD